MKRGIHDKFEERKDKQMEGGKQENVKEKMNEEEEVEERDTRKG